MAKSEFIGIALSGNDLKIARIRVVKKRIELISTDTVTLVTPLASATPAPIEKNQAADEADDMDSIFGLDDEGDNGELNLDDAIGGDDDFDMTEEGSEDLGGGRNELLLEAVLNEINPKKVTVGLNIPYGNTIFQFLKDNDYSALKKKERNAIIEEKLNSIYNKSISKDNYAYQVRDDKSLLLASFENDLPLLNLIDQTATYYKGNISIRDILADESVLIGLIRANYTLKDEEYTGIIHIGKESSRVLFLNGDIVHMVFPIINQGSNAPRILNTIFSKILFEIDKGELPNVDRLIITDHGGLGDKACDFFRKQLKDVPVDHLQFHPDKFIAPPSNGDGGNTEITGITPDTASYTTAIGLAWAISGVESEAFPKLSFIPGHVLDRQRVLKLEWHGMLLLMMIAVIPFITNHFYQENQTRIQALRTDIRLLNSQINETRPIATITEHLAAEQGQLNAQLELYNNLSDDAYKWSATLGLLNEGLRTVTSTWVTQLRSTDAGMVIEGYSLYRNRIPMLANAFKRATVQSVTEGEMRETRIYRFVILVDEIAGGEKFTPTEAVPPTNIKDSLNIDPFIGVNL